MEAPRTSPAMSTKVSRVGTIWADFAKAERPQLDALIDAVSDNVALLAEGRDSTFQNKVHLTMQAKGFTSKDDNGSAEKPSKN